MNTASEHSGRVYLVGAGCGESDLITVRGLDCIRHCDVLIYDDLISEKLLSEAPASAELLYMGKRSGKHSASQEEINSTIVEKAEEGKNVCRLKGGDPFVFGRGGEEILALQACGIPYEVVPGISSCIAIPSAAGIPVTHRKTARSFHVITGRSADSPDGLPEDMDTYAKLSGTLVFLMGLSQLEKISQRLMTAGKSSDTPAAVISGGNSAHPACVRGTLCSIAERVREAGVQTPAVIVVGETAEYDFAPTVSRPLAGVKIAVTGTDRVTGRLDRMLSELGARVTIAERSIIESIPFAGNTAILKNSTWLVFTSGNGVQRFFEILQERSVDIRSLAGCKFAVIGGATKKALAAYGIQADLCPAVYTGQALADAILPLLSEHDRVTLLRSAKGDPELAKRLSCKCPVDDIATYDTVPDRRIAEVAALQQLEPDYILFASAGGVQNYRETVGNISEKTACICIGGTALAELKNLYGIDGILSKSISVEGLVETVLEYNAGVK